MGIDSDRHDDFHAAAHVNARRETPRARADADRKRVAGTARLEQRELLLPCGFIAANDTRLAMQRTAPLGLPLGYGLDNNAS